HWRYLHRDKRGQSAGTCAASIGNHSPADRFPAAFRGCFPRAACAKKWLLPRPSGAKLQEEPAFAAPPARGINERRGRNSFLTNEQRDGVSDQRSCRSDDGPKSKAAGDPFPKVFERARPRHLPNRKFECMAGEHPVPECQRAIKDKRHHWRNG